MANAQIKITADVGQAERDLRALQKQVDALESSLHSGLNKALGATAAAAAAMGYAIGATLNSAGELIDAANNLGIAAQSLQAMQHAAALTGVSADSLNTALQRLNSNIGSALINGTGGATDALKQLGIPLKEIAALKADKQFEVIAAEINKIPNAAERSALAVELFGKQGPKMLAMAANITHAREEMERMGLALSDLDVAALDKAGDSVDELKMIFESGLKKAVAEIAPYIVAIVKSIKESITEAGGFEAVWGKVKSAIKTVIDLMVIIAAMKIAAGAQALWVAMRGAAGAAAVFNAVVKKNPLMLAVGAALVLAKILGLDIVGAMYDYTGLNDKVAESNKEIAADAAKIKQTNEENVVVTERLNKEQEKILKAFEDQISKLQDQVKYEQDKITLGEQQANINKMLSEEQRKLAEVGLTITEDQKQRITYAYTELENQKKISQEIERQKGVVKSLASAYKTELMKAIEDSSDVTKRNADMENRIARGQKVTIQEYIDNVRAKEQAEYNLTTAVLNLTNKGESERYAIEEKYSKQRSILWSQNQLLAQQGVDLKTALVNQEMAKELELYNLKVKLAQDEIALKANTMARINSDADAYYLKTIGGEKAVQEAAKQRAEFDAKTMYEKTQIGIEQGAQLFSALGAQNKKAFEAAKALNIASAIMNTYASVTKALAAYPFPFSLIPAGAALAMGMAQVSQIRAQSYSGRALGGPVMGGNPYIVGENGPELFTPQGTGSITRNGDLGGGGPTNINFTILANDAQGFDDLLAQRKGMITQMVNDAMVEKGQRM